MSNGRLSVKKRISAGYGMRGNLNISESLLMYLGNGTQKHSINSNVFFCRLLFLFIAQMILRCIQAIYQEKITS
ncbi:hypothetical protein PDPUS_1_01600 [Photobacterium damselae subsp. piscicida]|uniref:Uncharacterized protein n=1 Tax=Photobacterium damsela subsp. piscicida TaxID=38294 RepID=A0AAD1CEP7_PHODP|nr:hypothetical protein PDPUS_1_01600 [Photobacterium damselae subsp. piscicida]GAW45487.1 hypothetical protein PDPJ_1_02902 [Photobacterium damselae subsp. piscicida]